MIGGLPSHFFRCSGRLTMCLKIDNRKRVDSQGRIGSQFERVVKSGKEAHTPFVAFVLYRGVWIQSTPRGPAPQREPMGLCLSVFNYST